MVRPTGKGFRVQVVLDDEQLAKVDAIKRTNRLESYPQTLRLIIKYFNIEMFNERNETLYKDTNETEA